MLPWEQHYYLLLLFTGVVCCWGKDISHISSTTAQHHHSNAGGPQSNIKNSIKHVKCIEISIPMCKNIGYNNTLMPNIFNHDSQEEAGMEVHQYWPLVEIKCSADLKLFLCSLYVPICMEDYAGSVPPCRSLCERAKYGCEPVMIQYGFSWPERMKCDNFLKFGKNNVCMDEKNGELPPSITPVGTTTHQQQLHHNSHSNNSTIKKKKQLQIINKDDVVECSCKCNPPLININNYASNNNGNNNVVVTGGVANCVLPCHGGYDSTDEISFSNWWLTCWSCACCFITFTTIITFFIDPNRFKYPERPIIYLSTCYFMVSIGYLIRIWKGHEAIACTANNVIKYNLDSISSPWCLFVFLFIYYFGMSSSIWWVILSLTWYLAAGCKWGCEAISSHSHLFHIIAWVSPAIGTFIAIADGAIDGDAISGICLIGNQDTIRLIIYIILPLGILLILGTSFLFAGFISLLRIRQVIQEQGGRNKTEKLEKFMIRIGIFSILYTLPASSVLGAYFYEIWMKYIWLNGINCTCKNNMAKPLYSILMLKYFMSLAVGITSGVWIWSGKTIESWSKFTNHYFCFKKIQSSSSSSHGGCGNNIPKYNNTTGGGTIGGAGVGINVYHQPVVCGSGNKNLTLV